MTENSQKGPEGIVQGVDTELWVARNKVLVISSIVVILFSIIAWGANQKWTSDKNIVFDKKIYLFEKKTLLPFSEDKIKVEEVISKFNVLNEDIGKYKGLDPLTIKLIDELIAKKNLNQAKLLLEKSLNNLSPKNQYMYSFFSMRLSVIYEDLGEVKKAIEVLEKLNSLSLKLLPGKNYLDLGRLYMKIKNMEKAKVNFQYVIDNVNNKDFSKIARIYLSEITK